MRVLHHRIVVKFEETHNQVYQLGNTTIVRPSGWEHKQDDETATSKLAYNVNGLETKPQIASVVHPNEKYGYKVGDRLFLNYMAHETGEYKDSETKEAFIQMQFIIFRFNSDGTYEMADDVYLGEQVYSEGIKTESGIYLTPHDKIKETLKVKITHVPKDSKVEVGETVLVVDDYNYIIEVDGKKYIKLRGNEIVSKVYAETEETTAGGL